MLARLTSIRLFAVLLFAVPIVTIPGLRSAFAQAKEAEKEDESDEGGGEEEDAAKPDLTESTVTAGGNYTVENYPLSEVQRTLLMPQGGLEVQLDFDFDLRTKVGDTSDSFKTLTFTLQGRYGVGPTTNVKAAFILDASAPDGAAKNRTLEAGLEQAIVYDLLDVQGGLDIHFPSEGDSSVDIFIGLPVKYRLSDKIAVLGLEKILVIHTKEIALASGKTSQTPDFIISVAGEVNPIPALALILRASLNLAAADFDSRTLPVELLVLYALNHQFDIGLDITARNIAPPSSAPGVASIGALDSIGMGLFVRGRM